MLETLDTIQWALLSQPEWNKADAIPNSLLKLAACNYESGWHDAYMDFLSAVGNNHAGTYYPAVLHTFTFLSEILTDGSNSSQVGVLNALMELGTCFSPEPGYEYIEDSNSYRTKVSALLAQEIEKLLPLIHAIIAHPQKDAETKTFASQLLELLREQEEDNVET